MLKIVIGLIGISCSMTACSQTSPDKSVDQEQVAVNEIQSDLNAADAAIISFGKEGISCTLSRRTIDPGKDKGLEEHTFVNCNKSIAPNNKPKGRFIDDDWTFRSDGATYFYEYEPKFTNHCVGKKAC